METDSPSSAPRRLLARVNLRRAAAPIAIVATAALLAGCGTASSGGGSNTTTGTSTTSTNEFNPNLVPAGGSSPGTPPKSAKSKSGKSKSGSKSSGGGQSSAGTNGSTVGGSTGGGSGSVSSPGGSSGGAQTITVTHTSTVTHTVTQTKYVRPDVPAGAGLPSRSAAVSVSSFDAARGNIGCRISSGTVRCDVARRVWSPPRRPRSCRSGSSAWGQGLMVGSSGSSFFVCARNSVLDPTGTYIRSGHDDKVGSVTCQVRAFGVTCFESDGRGFFIGRTGYTRF
jgi:hypothetical protein